jgi:hypothetical protein
VHSGNEELILIFSNWIGEPDILAYKVKFQSIREVNLIPTPNEYSMPFVMIVLQFVSLRLWIDPSSKQNVNQQDELEKYLHRFLLFFLLIRTPSFVQHLKSLLRDQKVHSHLEKLHQSQSERALLEEKINNVISQESIHSELNSSENLERTLADNFEKYEKWIDSVSSIV